MATPKPLPRTHSLFRKTLPTTTQLSGVIARWEKRIPKGERLLSHSLLPKSKAPNSQRHTPAAQLATRLLVGPFLHHLQTRHSLPKEAITPLRLALLSEWRNDLPEIRIRAFIPVAPAQEEEIRQSHRFTELFRFIAMVGKKNASVFLGELQKELSMYRVEVNKDLRPSDVFTNALIDMNSVIELSSFIDHASIKEEVGKRIQLRLAQINAIFDHESIKRDQRNAFISAMKHANLRDEETLRMAKEYFENEK